MRGTPFGFKLECVALFGLCHAASQQSTHDLIGGWFMPPAGDFGLSPKVTKGLPKAFLLGYPPSKEIICK